jgi:hypothetical protein
VSPLLGGACKLSDAGVAPSGDPRFTGDPYSVVDLTVNPIDALAAVDIVADGSIDALINAGNQGAIGRWDNGLMSLNRNDFDFRADKISGDDLDTSFPGDPQNTWILGSTAPVFQVKVTGSGSDIFVGTLRIRPTGGGADHDTASLRLEAESSL